jgi:putative tryptophan/tyrosine transport system substrate-binding protein
VRRLLTSLLLYATTLLAAASQAETLNVRLVLSDSSPPYQQFAASFNKALVASQADVVVTESQLINDSNIDLIVTVGIKASELVAASQTGTPVLAVMIPKASSVSLLAQASLQNPVRSISAIYLDQPWDRQLDFVRAALPERRKIGLLYSEDTRIDVAHLHQDIAHRGGSLIARAIRSAEGLYPSLESVLEDSDVLLAIPDSAIYSSNNIRNILLTSYRYRIPLIGLSQSYVNAGALCAIFSTPEQLAEQASIATILFSRTRQLPSSKYPAAFTIAVNQQVARSLGIELPSPDAIRNQMDKAKSKEHGR